MRCAIALSVVPALYISTVCAEPCTKSNAATDFARAYVRFRNAEINLDRIRATKSRTLSPKMREEMSSKFVFDCRPLSYVFFYKKFGCEIDNINVTDSQSDEYLASGYDNKIPTDLAMMAIDVRHVVDGWFTFHHPGSYDPLPHDITTYTDDNRTSWTTDQVSDVAKSHICLSTIHFIIDGTAGIR